MMDVVYIFRKGPRDSVALRYSLRSLKNLPHGKVWLIGDCPVWTKNINHIRVPEQNKGRLATDKHLNAWRKLLIACNTPGISSDFYLFNDDFIITKPIDVFRYLITEISLVQEPSPSAYVKIMTDTARHFENPRNFEIHCPIIYNKEKLKALADIYNVMAPLVHRSLYGNHYNVEAQVAVDNKVSNESAIKHSFNKDVAFMSLNNNIEGLRTTKILLNRKFPVRSKYEK